MKPTGVRAGPPDCEHKDRPIYARRQCSSCYNRQYRIRNPQKYRDYQHKYYRANRASISIKNQTNQLRIKYGLTKDEVATMTERQGNSCAICRNPFTGRRGFLQARHIDHDHMTGQVRGLLCGGCNNGLGNFRDNPTSLRAAAQYLESSRQ